MKEIIIPPRDLVNIICFIILSLLGLISAAFDNVLFFRILNLLATTYFAYDFFKLWTIIAPSKAKSILLLHHFLAFSLIVSLGFDMAYRAYFLLDMAAEMNSIFLVLRKSVKAAPVQWAHTISWYVMRLGCTSATLIIFIYRVFVENSQSWFARDKLLVVFQIGLLCIQFYWHFKFYLPGKYSLLNI